MNKLSILAFLPSALIFLPLWLVFLHPGEITTSQARAATTGREVVPVSEFLKNLHEVLNKLLNMNKLSILAFLPRYSSGQALQGWFSSPKRAGTGAGTVLYFPPMLLPRCCRPLLIFTAPKHCA
ncbi:MAG TPA: hypothetical protein VG738_24895 [Chitinophagaceae bacterium]|nr:hypothetical protein [Chitinophagaceae bacterium]